MDHFPTAIICFGVPIGSNLELADFPVFLHALSNERFENLFVGFIQDQDNVDLRLRPFSLTGFAKSVS